MKYPWTKWFWTNYRSDPGVRQCGAIARGVWIEMLGLMHEAKPRGWLSPDMLVPEVLAKATGLSVEEIRIALPELERNGVFSRDERGWIYCRRMVRETEAEADQAAGLVACETCGKRFKPGQATQKYCSRACQQAAYRSRHAVTKQPSRAVTRAVTPPSQRRHVCDAGSHHATGAQVLDFAAPVTAASRARTRDQKQKDSELALEIPTGISKASADSHSEAPSAGRDISAGGPLVETCGGVSPMAPEETKRPPTEAEKAALVLELLGHAVKTIPNARPPPRPTLAALILQSRVPNPQEINAACIEHFAAEDEAHAIDIWQLHGEIPAMQFVLERLEATR